MYFLSLLPKFKSDVCKWHLFFSNLTEDVYQVLNDTFFMDYKRELRFQSLLEENEGVPQEPATITVPESDEVLKGSVLYSSFLYSHANPLMISILFFV